MVLPDTLVILKDHEGDPGADGNGDFDITSRVTVLEAVDGAPIRAVITLDAREGRYITKTPKIKKWDRIYIEITDKNSIKFKTVVHVKKIKKMRKGSGALVKLICPHQSSNLLSRTISAPNRRTSGYASIISAVAQLNDDKGTKDPTVIIQTPFSVSTKNGIRLDQGTNNTYTNESVTFARAVEMAITKEASPVEAGGSFEWHYFRFVSLYAHPSDTDLDKVAIQIFEQGYKNNGGSFTSTPTVTIKKNQVTGPPSNLIDTDSSLETEQATNLIAIGSKTAGTYLKDTMKFHGAKDVFNSARLYDISLEYYAGALVTNANLTYEAIGFVPVSTPPPNASYWIARTFTKPSAWSSGTTYAIMNLVNYKGNAWKSLSGGNLNHTPDTSPTWWVEVNFVPGVDYSPLTKDKAQYWINAGAGWNLAGTSASKKTAVADPNVIIQDTLHPRTWVDATATASASIPTTVLRNGTDPFDTLRILCNGTGTGDFAGNDPNGVSKSNAVLEYRGVPGAGGAWYVFKSGQQDLEVVDMRQGDSWIYKPCETGNVDGAGVCSGTRNSGWVQGAYFLVTVGPIQLGGFTTGANFDCLHTVKRNTGTGIVEFGNEEIITEVGSPTSAVYVNFSPNGIGSGDNKPSAYFAGMNFAFPWPRNSNSIPHGAVTIGEKIDLNAFDLDNLDKNSKNTREWFGELVEELFPIQGFRFFHLIQEFFNFGLLFPTGDYSMGIWIADRYDNVGVIEYTHQRNADTSPIDAPLGKIQIYRGVPGVSTFLPARKPEITNILDKKSIVRGGIYTKDSYDADGRYRSSFINLNNATDRFGNTEKIHLAIDAFAMSKPIVATNIRGTKPDRNIETQKLREEQIVSYAQLVNFVKSMELILAFERAEWPVKTDLRCDIGFGDPMYLEDSELIDETTDALPNTIKVVADEIIYSISKTSQGPGGATRSIKGITRIWP